MPRTTVTLDASVLQALKRRAREEGKTLGQLISEIVAPALKPAARQPPSRSLRWTSRPMRPRVDLEDKEAVHEALDRE